MINAQELTIGNLLSLNGNTLEVSSIGPDFISVEDGGLYAVEEFEPVLITEEMLLKLGAYKVGIEYNLKASALKITIRINAGHVYCEFGNVYLGGRIKYVHQLQNLFHALCGKELEVTI